MPAHNATGDSNIRVVSADRAEQLRLYDALPRHWRQLVDSLPVPQDLREVSAVRAKFGEERGYQLICQVYQEQYPSWHPEEGWT